MGIADKDKERTVTLAGRKFVVEQIPMARMRQLGPKVAAIASELMAEVSTDKNAEAIAGNSDLLGKFIDKLLDIPHELLSLFIKGLPKDIFEDEENGVTFPEFQEALNQALTLNRADVLKNFFTKLAPSLSLVKR